MGGVNPTCMDESSGAGDWSCARSGLSKALIGAIFGSLGGHFRPAVNLPEFVILPNANAGFADKRFAPPLCLGCDLEMDLLASQG